VAIEAGATVHQAVVASGLLERFPEVDRSDLAFAIFGTRVRADAPLHEGDRVEILRPLQVDPKEARRLRARKR
jgi:putative ubiquitin-RnfH superfamily antitoxin RatB of RatAB toxin-antitoxin module